LRGCRRLETPRNEKETLRKETLRKETLRKGGTRFPSLWLRLPAGVKSIAASPAGTATAMGRPRTGIRAGAGHR